MTKIIIKFILLNFLLIWLFSSALNSQSTITLDTFRIHQNKIPKTIYGVFIEYLKDYINGTNGFWSQELQNRGFDYSDDKGVGTSRFWSPYSNKQIGDELFLVSGGYNENGKYFQKIDTKNSTSELGVYQKVYVSDTVGGDFYTYLKGDIRDAKVYLKFIDTISGEVYFSQEISNIDSTWKKYSISTPAIHQSHFVKLAIVLQGKGQLDIDETSFMPSNNVMGIRKEFYDIFTRWKPGIIRYPGGTFVDTHLYNWKEIIVDIDKRRAPISFNGDIDYDYDQRMDFGLNEYLNFCKIIGAEPHLVVNMIKGTPQDASDLSDYCNGDTNTYYGSVRAEKGFPEPFGVKYWEIGNEQWSDPVQTGKNHIPFYDILKAKDSTYQIMVSGNTWGGESFFDGIYNTVGEKTDFYSYHDITPAKPKNSTYNEEQRYYSVMGASKLHDNMFQYIKGWANKFDFSDKIKLALTEYLIIYDVKAPFWIDTSYKNASFETGVWMAGVYNSFIRNSDFQQIFEKTFGLGHIRIGLNSKGERIIYPTPTHTMMEFARHHTGDFIIPVEVDCPKYSTELIEGLYQSFDVPMLDVCVTVDNKKLYISVVNKHFYDSLETQFNFPFDLAGTKGKLYELFDEKYYIANTPDEPKKIKIKERDYIFANNYKFPPHSYTLFEMPFDKELYLDVVDNAKNGIFIFPNPVVNELNLLIPTEFSQNSFIEIYDMLGNIVLNASISDNDLFMKINVSSLARGVYSFVIRDNKQVKSSKFIKIQ